MNDTGPEGVPPPVRVSFVDRSVERSVPVPDPYLKMMASDFARSMIPEIESSTPCMKQAWTCGCLWMSSFLIAFPPIAGKFRQLSASGTDRPGTRSCPTLNHTGELNEK